TIQSLVAEEKIDKEYVALHWFQRNKKGITQIKTAELDENGAYGDWPEDFGDVALKAESRYLNAPMK
ncbi:DUF3696 domain-containing protein, partial [bacterium]|nr:DUF3696 domain-containing protein [bacterium]